MKKQLRSSEKKDLPQRIKRSKPYRFACRHVNIIIIIFGLLISILTPIIINCLFISDTPNKYPTVFGPADLLGYTGAIIGGTLTLVGVVLTLKNNDRNLKQDTINRVKPVLHFLSLKYDCTKPILPDRVHETAFYRIEKLIYDYCPKTNRFKPKTEFDAETIKLLSDLSLPQKHFCMSLDLENIGVGSASNVQILLTDDKDSFDVSNQYVSLSPLNACDKIPIYIFSADASNILERKFYFNLLYYDIYGNLYNTQTEFIIAESGYSPLSLIFYLDRGKTYFTPQENLGNINSLSTIEINK